MSKIPKKIWGLWCNFNEKKDGVINETLNFFISIIKNLHPSWEINIITKWDELINYIKEDAVLSNLLDNNFVGAAHKSDMIRYFFLKKYGGVWIDISTFLVAPLDKLIETSNTDFICYYASSIDVREWLFKPLAEFYESVEYKNRIDKWIITEEEFISLKNKNLDFIPENYFICSSPNHKIITLTYDLLTEFWSNNLQLINSKETLCYYQDAYIVYLIEDIFNTHIMEINLFKRFNNKTFDERNYKLLFNTFDCGYLFNYLQLYIAIESYCELNKPYKLDYLEKPIEKETNAFKDLCINNWCKDIQISFNNGTPNILLLSAAYNRAAKWSDNLEERLSWDNTYLGNKIKSITSQEQAEQMLKEFEDNGLTQFKFGAYTRNSKIIPNLMKWYKKEQNAGRKKKNKKTKKIKKIQKIKTKRYRK